MEELNCHITTRISKKESNLIKEFCLRHHLKDRSSFIRYAITEVLTPDVEDKTLVFESLKQVHDKLHAVESQQDILFSFLCYFIRHFLIYNPEIPAEQKESAARSAAARYDKFFKSYQKSLIKDSSSMFESLLADFVEETDD